MKRHSTEVHPPQTQHLLPADPAALLNVFTGDRGLLTPRGGIVPSLFINMSTVDPQTSRDLAERVAATRLAAVEGMHLLTIARACGCCCCNESR